MGRSGAAGLVVVMMASIAAGCAHVPSDADRVRALVAAGRVAGEPIVDPLWLDRAARDEVVARIGRAGTALERAARLTQWLGDEHGLAFRYDAARTSTAAQAWIARAGNCLAYAHLYNALARELGIPMRYVRYRSPRGYEERSGRLVVVSHVASLYEHPGGSILVELSSESFSAWMSDYEVLRDDQAAALHASNLAMERLAAGDAAGAERTLRFLVAQVPELPDLHNNLGAILLRRRAYTEALAVLEHAIARFPRFAALYANAAQAARALGDPARADRLAAEARAPSADPFVPFIEGAALLEAGRVAAAVEIFERVAALEPRSATFHAWLARGLAGLGRLEPARAAYRRALALNPRHPMLPTLRAVVRLTGE